jgi:dTDP-4-dehydrorhamnose reductase
LNQDKSLKLNIQDEYNISSILNTLKPQIIISCLRGDFNKQLILHVKTAEYLRENGGSLYFFSTTNVFDNDLSKPHYEDDLPNSHTDYGQYKIECEKKISEILHDNACILRIPQVWGKSSPRMKELLSSLHSNKDIIVYPKFYCNTNTDVMIARQLCCIINNNLKGIFHLVPEDIINYKDFYKELMTGLGFRNANIEENSEEEGYFALLSKRTNEFPEQLRFTNKSVIDYLIN